MTWELNLGDCLSVVEAGTWEGGSLTPDGGDPAIGYDPTTYITGIKFDQGFNDNDERNYYFTVDGNYDEGTITFASKAGSDYDTVEVTGPNATCESPRNDPPDAQDDSVEGNYNAPVTIPVLGNDSDPDGDPLSNPVIVTGPANGTVTVNPDGTITYTPAPDFCGDDMFTYEVNDGEFSDQADVSVTIPCPANKPPTATDDIYDVTEDTILNVDDIEGVLANDSDPDNDPLSVSEVVNQPTNGQLTVNPDGSFSYEPTANFCGTDGFDYVVSDGNGGTDEGHVTLNVACVNDPPIAKDDTGTTQENLAVTIDVLGNDSDDPSENDPIHISSVDPNSQFGGTITNNGDGSVVYTPPADFAGTDSFTYEICDDPSGQPGLTSADSLCDTATVTVTVLAKYNRSIEVDLIDFTLSGTNLMGDFTVQNMSGAGKLAQVDEFKITAEYRDGNKWMPVSVENCTFNPAAPDVLAPESMNSYTFSCETADDVSGYSVRVIANVHLFGRIKGSHEDGWFWERHTK